MDDEEVTQTFVAEYSRQAEFYDGHAAPYFVPMAKRVIELAGLKAGDDVLDLGCGTGNLTFLAAAKVGPGGKVIGVDLAEGALRVAARKAAQLEVPSCEFDRMDCRELVFPSRRVDAVLSCFGIPILGHGRCFQEAGRVTKEGGRFVFCEWAGSGSVAGRTFLETLARYRVEDPPEELRRLREARRYLSKSPEPAQIHSPDSVTSRLREAGFSQIAITIETQRAVFPDVQAFLDFRRAFGDDDRELKAMSEANRGALQEEFEERMGMHLTAEGLVFEWEIQYCQAFR